MGWFTQIITQLGRQIPAAPPPRPQSARPQAGGMRQNPPRMRRKPGNRPPRPMHTPGRRRQDSRGSNTRPRTDSQWTCIVYHGTPNRDNAKAIFRNGFLVGRGNAAGDGVYFATDPSVAKGYAGAQGIILKCQVRGRCCQWNDQLQRQYSRWCADNAIRQDNSARTAFLILRGFDLLRTGEVIVVLSPQMVNPSAWQQKDRRIRVLGAYDSSATRRIRV